MIGFSQKTDSSPPGQILLVDDERTMLLAVTKMLRPLGYTIHAATSGAEGLKILEQEPIDLVISDMRMPAMDGAAFLAEVSACRPDVVCMLMTAYTEIELTAKAINKGRIFAYFSKPLDRGKLRDGVEQGLAFRRKTLELRRNSDAAVEENQRLKDANSQLEAAVAERTEKLDQTRKFLEMAYDQIKQAYFQTVNMFAQIVERGEQLRSGHGQRVAELAVLIARQLGMSDELINDIHTAGLLHDAGKVGFPDRIRNRETQALTPQEMKLMRTHPIEGAALLMSLEPLYPVADLIRSHHEKYDGSGYPDGLKGERIPVGSRILHVCDVYDSLLNGYVDGRSLAVKDALSNMQRRVGSDFDPIIFELLAKAVRSEEEQSSDPDGIPVVSSALEPGMRIARTLVTSRKVPLIVADVQLTDSLIEKLRAYEADSGEEFTVFIHKEEEAEKPSG
ncbi:MAG: response regulator [Pontiellaceae bacterium]|nr:response regulator [Pontiellaceae bacterium]